MDRIEMSSKEIRRLEVLGRVAEGACSQRSAGVALGLSERQVRRLLRKYGQASAEANRRTGALLAS
jgi:hypothetical protein